MGIAFVTVVLIAAMVLLVRERPPVDLVALGIIVVLMVAGILLPEEALAGLAHPAPITVAALLIAGQGLVRTGALESLTERMVQLTGGNSSVILLLVLLITGGFSTVVNNTPVVVLVIPVVMAISAQYRLSSSKFLLPVSYVSILAGTSTLIGTSTNIIVSDLSGELGHGEIEIFELSVLGVPLGLVGALLLFFLAPRLLPDVRAPLFEARGADDVKRHYISELLIPEQSPLNGQANVRAALAERYSGVEVYEVIGEDGICGPHAGSCPARSGDVLLVKASADDLAHMLEEKLVVLPKGEDGTEARPFEKGSLIVELIVPPGSSVVGSWLSHSLLGPDPQLHILGVLRRRVHYSQQKWIRLQLRVGDIILVQAPLEHIERLREQTDLIVVEDVVRTIVNRRLAPLAAGIFGAMVLAASTGLSSILVASLAAAFLMIATGCLALRDAYTAIDQKILLLIIGTLALGAALMKTGAAELYARTLLSLVGNASPQLVLAVIVVLTSVLSHFLSNNATAVLAVPIAISAALEMGVDPRPFVIGICFGASACFATPIGYQTNLLVYGPGGYRALDYFKLGMPLNLLVWIGASLFIPLLWPF